ncbi:hypothetical protein ACRQ5Q_27855 [Bradyrhizobium sp. PMVTL-01]|jgi:hypothetical protein|uniref:hypothetical protein n=1 Tax=unclassified Bradyrhizobium TaxID=2631580 RepID=UPI003F71BC15
MRDVEVLLNSLVDVDRSMLISVLSMEVQTATKLAMSGHQRTAWQRAKRRSAIEHAARLAHILAYFKYGETPPGMSEDDRRLCSSLVEKRSA